MWSAKSIWGQRDEEERGGKERYLCQTSAGAQLPRSRKSCSCCIHQNGVQSSFCCVVFFANLPGVFSACAQEFDKRTSLVWMKILKWRWSQKEGVVFLFVCQAFVNWLNLAGRWILQSKINSKIRNSNDWSWSIFEIPFRRFWVPELNSIRH